VGHETFAHVWSPETVGGKSFIGKVEGHMEPVAAAKFIPGSTILVSIDEKLSIRLTDIYTFECQ